MQNDLSDELQYQRNDLTFEIQEALIHLEQLERGQIKVIGLDPNIPQADPELATGEYIAHFRAHLATMKTMLALIDRVEASSR
ncbi:hypothetical protein AB4Z52_07040 [Rhizobium sp. 2YAF20]|uniref:hypothetical protein n=1 Tax=Rhizobium sp. 2YAF20 TaxID=3233027 RepID=UPI003F988B83